MKLKLRYSLDRVCMNVRVGWKTIDILDANQDFMFFYEKGNDDRQLEVRYSLIVELDQQLKERDLLTVSFITSHLKVDSVILQS